MRLVKPSFEILEITYKPLELIEKAGRTCYKSEEKITKDSAKIFVENILKKGHESVIEHSSMTVKFICDRGVSHELVRHRLCAFSQESTRYCNYSGGVTFVIPPWCLIDEGDYNHSWLDFNSDSLSQEDYEWIYSMERCEESYLNLLNMGWSPQQARSILPNSLKTEIVVTANLREWHHIFNIRCSIAAHPQMRELMIPLLKQCKEEIPIIFDNTEDNYLTDSY